MKYLDIHCHLNFDDFNSDRKEVIECAQAEGVGMIVVGTDLESSKKAIEIAHDYENIWATIGMHPTDEKEKFDLEIYKKLAKNKKVVGIGECGLDYYRGDYENREYQKEVFEKHIEIANESNKPLMLHLRSSASQNAYEDALEIIKKKSKVRGNVHFFAGSYGEAKKFFDLGFTISFTGVITFARNYDEIIKNAPLNMIMSETDAPYVSPIPYRGKRNEPVFVKEVAHMIAKIRGESDEKVLTQLVYNGRLLFSI